LSVCEYDQGYRNGTNSQYHINGQLEIQGFHIKGKRCGEWKMWYKSGNIMCATHFNNNVRCGIYTEYYDTQQHHLMKQYHFNDEGEECDTFKMWWPPLSCDKEKKKEKEKEQDRTDHPIVHNDEGTNEHKLAQYIESGVETHQLKYYCKYNLSTMNYYSRYIEWDKQGNCIVNVNDINDDNNGNKCVSPYKLNVYKSVYNSDLNVEYVFN